MAWTRRRDVESRLDRWPSVGNCFHSGCSYLAVPVAGGAEPSLVRACVPSKVSVSKGSIKAIALSVQMRWLPERAGHAGELFARKSMRKLNLFCRSWLAADSDNGRAALRPRLRHQQQEDWDQAFDSLSESTTVDAGLSDVHSRLAYLLYRADRRRTVHSGGRTALSIDPEMPEAYRFLASDCTRSAVRSGPSCFSRVSCRPPDSADVYYDLGITSATKEKLTLRPPRTVRQLSSIAAVGSPQQPGNAAA